jgi:hypothetical protein
MRRNLLRLALSVLVCATCHTFAADFSSHPPQRPLPVGNPRPLPSGDIHVVDAVHGNDAGAGTVDHPWKTLDHALAQLSKGGVICLRGGAYYVHATVHSVASREKPLVIRSWPGELAVLDGGIPEFAQHPETAWEPCKDGVAGEYSSTRTYPVGAPGRTSEGDGDGEVLAMGRFIDSMIPLHGCRFHGDLQSDNQWWTLKGKNQSGTFVYCGPSVWQDGTTGRIHCRLAPTKLPIGDDNYTGIADPQRTPLCIATIAAGPVLTIDSSRHVELQDLVIRGSVTTALLVTHSADVSLDGVTIYGGGSGMDVEATAGLRLIHCACRGMAAPWMYRGALKYRSVEARLLSASTWMPMGIDNRDFEIAYSEFTDSEDSVFLGAVQGVRFHHNLLENIHDDGLFLTVPQGYDGHVAGGNTRIWQNRLASCLTTFSFGVGHGRQITLPDHVQTGDGVWITRNVIDLRRTVRYHWPQGPEDTQLADFRGRFGGDHGSPVWEPMWIYHNTIVGGEIGRADFGIQGLGVGMGKGTTRHVIDNILCVDVSKPGVKLPNDASHFTAEGNIIWSFDAGAPKPAAPAGNQLADPGFKHYAADWREDVDLTPRAAVAGAAIPEDWFEPIHSNDIGALPADGTPWRIGVRGRLDVCGRASAEAAPVPNFTWSFPDDHPNDGPHTDAPRALSIRGYPALDAPIFEYLLRRRGVQVESHDRQAVPLSADLLARQQLIVYDGSLARANVQPATLGASDVAALEHWLQQGGTLILGFRRQDIFDNDAGHAFLVRNLGSEPPPATDPLPVKTTPVGKGRIIVLGSSTGSTLTDNRRGSTAEADAAMLAQVHVLEGVLDDWLHAQPHASPAGR